MRFGALNTGPDFHLLDHIAPLSCLIKAPLFIEEEKNFTLAQKFYPMAETGYLPEIEHHLGKLAADFDVLFECKYWTSQLKKVFWDFYQKKPLLLFCAHGQSDKGYKAPCLDAYALQDGALVYGNLLEEMLTCCQIPARTLQTGNIRLFFYLQHKEFYDALTQEEVFSKLPPQKTILYAPTWKDRDEATTFFETISPLLAALPKNWNLIVKVHPLLEMRNPEEYYRTAALLEGFSNVQLLSEFPLIYPLLSRVDAVLGDYSSVGYDFLAFQRPMFFLLRPGLPKGRLHTCGVILEDVRDLFGHLEKPQDFSKEQAALYAKAFEVTRHLEAGEQRLCPNHKDLLQQAPPLTHRDGCPVWEDIPALQYPPASREGIRHQIQLLLKDPLFAKERSQILEGVLHL